MQLHLWRSQYTNNNPTPNGAEQQIEFKLQWRFEFDEQEGALITSHGLWDAPQNFLLPVMAEHNPPLTLRKLAEGEESVLTAQFFLFILNKELELREIAEQLRPMLKLLQSYGVDGHRGPYESV